MATLKKFKSSNKRKNKKIEIFLCWMKSLFKLRKEAKENTKY